MGVKDDWLPYRDFVDHFGLKKGWIDVIMMPDSPVVKLLKLEDVFVKDAEVLRTYTSDKAISTRRRKSILMVKNSAWVDR